MIPAAVDTRREASRGVLAMTACCVVWGLSPLYYKLLSHVPPPDVLAHRTLWSLAFFAGLLALQGRLPAAAWTLGSARRFGRTALAAMAISINWLIFIFAVGAGRVTEASLGYFVFPLVSVAFGALLFRERLAPAQWGAVGIAAAAVGVLAVGLASAPWISLALALSFGAYGVVKKGGEAGPVVSVTGEVLLLAPLAVLWLAFFAAPAGSLGDLVLLAVSGPLTGVPLVLFSYAAKRVSLATVGLMQYINPFLQLVCAAVIFSEPLSVWHWFAFPAIWLALAIYSAVAIRRERSSRRQATSEATVGAT